MPNWCFNIITVEGDNEQIALFLKKYFDEENNFDFDKVIPEPREEKDCPTDCIRKDNDHIEVFEDRPWFNWYVWRNKYWGTKWNACGTHIDNKKDKCLKFVFDTAWCEPYGIIDELHNQNPHLHIYHDFECEEYGVNNE